MEPLDSVEKNEFFLRPRADFCFAPALCLRPLAGRLVPLPRSRPRALFPGSRMRLWHLPDYQIAASLRIFPPYEVTIRGSLILSFYIASRNSGVAQWLACWAHNPKVRGSKPCSARQHLPFCTDATPCDCPALSAFCCPCADRALLHHPPPNPPSPRPWAYS